MARKDLPKSSDIDEASDIPSDPDAPSEPETTPPRIPANSQHRWLSTLRSYRASPRSRTSSTSSPVTQPALAKARAEVLSGFRSRTASVSSTRKPSGKLPAQDKVAASEPTARRKGKGKGKVRESEDEIVRAIHLLPEAWLGHSFTVNNSGDDILSIRYLAPTATERAALEYRGLSRYSTPQNPIRLDPSLNRQETAAHLANLFQYPYRLYQQYAELSDNAPAPEDWVIQLHKERLYLQNVEGRSGTTIAEMLALASHEGRRAATREIFLTVPFVIEGSNSTMTIRPDSVCGDKRKSRADDSSDDDDIIEAKRSKPSNVKGKAIDVSPPSVAPTRTLRPRPRPKPRSQPTPISQQPTTLVVDTGSDDDWAPVPAAQPCSSTPPPLADTAVPSGSAPASAPSPSPTVIDVDELYAATASFGLGNHTGPHQTRVAGPGPQSLSSRRDQVAHEMTHSFNYEDYQFDEEEDPFGSSYTL